MDLWLSLDYFGKLASEKMTVENVEITVLRKDWLLFLRSR
jgi:hypothetical protein